MFEYFVKITLFGTKAVYCYKSRTLDNAEFYAKYLPGFTNNVKYNITRVEILDKQGKTIKIIKE